MIPPYRNAVCKGSLALGTACRRCERCEAEREKMRAEPVAGVAALAVITDGKEPSILGLPVRGYKKEQPAHLVALVNENKLLEELVLRQIEFHQDRGSELDQRFVALARTKIQEAFMELNRAVFQPQRLTECDGTTALIVKLLDRSR